MPGAGQLTTEKPLAAAPMQLGQIGVAQFFSLHGEKLEGGINPVSEQ